MRSNALLPLLASTTLLLAALAPNISAHLDPGGHLDVASTPATGVINVPFVTTGFRSDPTTVPLMPGALIGSPHSHKHVPDIYGLGIGAPRVSGWYVGSANAYLDAHADKLFNLGPVINANGEAGSGVQHALSSALCDLEVVDGTGIADEAVVDGAPTGGLAQDGIWNDGGVGAACHRPPGYYAVAAYNTGGCPFGGWARAEDAVLGEEVWISAACDYLTQVGGPGITDTYLGCAAQQARAGGAVILPCTLAFVACAIVPACVLGPVSVCGADGIPDAFNFGEGDGETGPGVPLPAIGLPCLAGAGVASVYTWDAVAVRAMDVRAPPGLDDIDCRDFNGDLYPDCLFVDALSVPTNGWIG